MYIPVFWKDRVVEFPRRVSITNLGNGIQEWTPAPGEIIERGTHAAERDTFRKYGFRRYGKCANGGIYGNEPSFNPEFR